MSPIPYNPLLKPRARELRNHSTLAEILLWQQLRGRQRRGFDFHRQKPILDWIADFFSADLLLAIEIDGDSHRAKTDSDAAKTSGFASLGITLLRFGDSEVRRSPEDVAARIDAWIDAHLSAAETARQPVKGKPVPTSPEHTPAFGHPSQEGSSVKTTSVRSSDPLSRGVPAGRGVFLRTTLHLRPPSYPANLPSTRFAAHLATDSPDGCAIALLGIPDDTGVRLNHGRPGAAEGPAAFRAALARYGAAQPAAPASGWPRVFDAGDVTPAATLVETHARVTAATRALHERGLLPIAVGGGHDLTFPFVRAVAEHARSAGHAALDGVYFDAHLDVRDTPGSGMAFRRLVEDGHVRTLHLHGFRPFVNSREHHAWFVAHGGHVHVDAPPAAAPALPAEPTQLFVSFDLDVLDAAFAPGVSAPNPAGWTPLTAERWVLAAGADPRVRCFDLMELCPPHDEGGRTARLAAHLFLTFLAGFATR